MSGPTFERDSQCFRSLHRVAHFDAQLPSDLTDQLWTNPKSLLAHGEPLRESSLRHTVRLDWGSRQFVFKHYRPTWWHAVRQLPTPSRPATCAATNRLIEAGIATPRPVAVIENRWGVFRRDSFLMYEYQEGRTLRSYFSREAKESRTVSDSLWQQLHELWQRLGQLRASLADTNTGNFIVCPDGRLWVIDLDNARFHRLQKTAARYQQRGWAQLLRSAAKC